MIKGKTILAVIPARGGSKEIPRKNIASVGGRPLIAWTIEEARKSKYIDRLVVSSDDDEIIETSRLWGGEVPFVRPAELAQDETPGGDPVVHAIEMLPGYDYVILLQPTSPLRQAADIDGCIEKCVRLRANACVSVVQSKESPLSMFSIDEHDNLIPLLQTGKISGRRQDRPAVYVVNGAVYIARCEWMRDHRLFVTQETLAYVMPKERSLDIDTEFDLKVLKLLVKRKVEYEKIRNPSNDR